jgi:hypothetical protein
VLAKTVIDQVCTIHEHKFALLQLTNLLSTLLVPFSALIACSSKRTITSSRSRMTRRSYISCSRLPPSSARS